MAADGILHMALLESRTLGGELVQIGVRTSGWP